MISTEPDITMFSSFPTVPGFKPVAPQVRTGCWADPMEHKWRGPTHPTPVWRIFRERQVFRLARPLLLRVWTDEGFFFVENESLRVCGIGTTKEEAFVDFGVHLVHFCEYYSDIPVEKLTGDAVRLKEIFQDLLVAV